MIIFNRFFLFFARKIKNTFILVLSVFCLSASASDMCPREDDASWDESCFEKKADGDTCVKKYYMANLSPNEFGATLIRRGNVLSFVDRFGVVRVDGVVFDQVSIFNNGMGRYNTVINNKCGYFSNNLKVVIPAQYDGCERFKNNVAFVCSGCVEYCTDSDCHDHVFIEGEGYLINKKGFVLKKIKNQKINTMCKPPSVLVNKINENPPYIRCEYPGRRVVNDM